MAKKMKRKPATPANLKVRNKRIIRVRVGDILKNPRNHRTHPEIQRESFDAATREIGFFGYPDVFETEDGGIMLVDGELRQEHLAGWYGEDAYIDVNLTDFTEAEAAEALLTKDQLAAMAGVDDESYAALLRELHAETEDERFASLLEQLASEGGIDLEEDDGGDGNGGTPGNAEPEMDRAAELREKWGVEPGQIWEIRSESTKHRLAIGDAASTPDVQKLLAGAEPFLMVSAFPSNFEGETDAGDAWANFPGKVAYLWHKASEVIRTAEQLASSDFHLRSYLVRQTEPEETEGEEDYRDAHESAWYAVRKGSSAQWNGDRTQSTVWQIESDEAGLPVECMRRPIRNHGDSEVEVYDPFASTGTTIVAAANEGRNSYAMEINPDKAAVAIERLAAIGLECRLIDQGD